MKNIRIVIDSCADLKEELRAKMSVVPMTIMFGDEEYIDGETMTRRSFYEHLAVCKDLPSTSQPSPDAFARVFEEAIAAGEQVVALTVASKLSGTFQSANIAAMDYPGDVFVVDTETAAIGEGVLAEYALQLVEQGLCAADVAAALNREKHRVVVLAALDTLEYLQRGGRISKTAAFAGGLLNIKPVIALRGGEIAVAGKARGAKQGHIMLNKTVEETGGMDLTMPVILGYTGLEDTLLQAYTAGSTCLPADAFRTNISGTIGTHVGPGAYAVAYFRKG